MNCHVCEQPATHQCSICQEWLCDEHAEPYGIKLKGLRVQTYVCSDNDECMSNGLKKAVKGE